MIRRMKEWVRRPGAWRSVVPAAVFLAGLALAWPPAQSPRVSSDSLQYLDWLPDRLLTYCGFAGLFGATPWLCYAQTVLSVGAWCFLGHTLARIPGTLAAAALAVSFNVSQWNLVALSESVFVSLLVLLLAWSVRLWRDWSGPRLAAWTATALLLLVCRPTGVYLFPFLVPPFLLLPRRRALWTCAYALAVWAPAWVYTTTASANVQRSTLVHVIGRRILTDPAATEYFRARGMPYTQAVRDHAGRAGGVYQVLLVARAPELVEWTLPRGREVYTRWLLTRGASYREAWEALSANLNNARLTEGTFGRNVRPNPCARALMPAYRVLGGIPPWLWAAGVLTPLLAWTLRRRVPATALFGALLIPATYAQAFVCFHADAFEIERHVWPAIVLYRIALLFLLAAAWELAVGWAAERRPSPLRPSTR